MSLQVKICGMKEAENVSAISALRPDFMGFIFYSKSKRCVNEKELPNALKELQKDISKVAVFVNENSAEVKRICKEYAFHYAQLHGQEAPSYCAELREAGISVIKAFPMDEHFEMKSLDAYVGKVDLFLFDTKTPLVGGSGKHFDWTLLRDYNNPVSYLLSGGISAEDIDQIKALHLPGLIGIDANSKLEVKPGLKDIEKTETLILKTRRA
jgi:phosphoribosylanthranilate isomerase